MSRRTICFITGSRADSSPLTPLISALIARDCGVQLIETVGLIPHEMEYKAKLENLRPDIVIVLGDRYETLVAASVAALLSIPIAHLSGGDETVGAVDNGFRHAITKLAYWHFPGCRLHADRIIQMGENPDRVFPLGFPAVDLLAEPVMSRHEIEARLCIRLKSPLALVCYHPETLGWDDEKHITQIKKLLGNYETAIISGPNADIGGVKIHDSWRNYLGAGHSLLYRETYPQRLWTSLMHHADALIGNSSGFIIEGLTMQRMFNGKPKIIIIGDRQKGRYQDACAMFDDSHVFADEGELWKDGRIFSPFPFGKPGTVAPIIADTLMNLEIPNKPRKEFYALRP